MSKRASILIVDDHPANLLTFEAVLAPLGCRMVTAKSGDEALKHVLREEFAVILMDAVMPGLDGFQTAALIKEREQSRDVPIIFVSAQNKETADVIRGYAFGAVDYVVKPFDPDILRSKVSVFAQLYLRGKEIERQAALLRVYERRAVASAESILASALDCIITFDDGGSILEFNPAAESAFGYRRADVLGKSFAILTGPWEAALDKRIELSGVRADGSEFPIELAVTRVRGVEPPLFTAYVRDVTEPKRAALERDRLYAAAQNAIHSRDELLAVVSHDLRNPLSSIILGADILARDLSAEHTKAHRQIRTIAHAADCLEHLIKDLLDFASLEVGHLSIDRQLNDVAAILADTQELMEPIATKQQLQLTVQMPTVSAKISCDRARVLQMFSNLIGNSIKFTPAGGHVFVRTDLKRDQVEFSVKDNGPGIARADLDRIFDRYWQAKPGARNGIGLGLSITKGIVSAHDGAFRVESEVGSGTTFYVTLPASTAEPAR